MSLRIGRAAYAEMFGPTVGDRVRLADTDRYADLYCHTVLGRHSDHDADCHGGDDIHKNGQSEHHDHQDEIHPRCTVDYAQEAPVYDIQTHLEQYTRECGVWNDGRAGVGGGSTRFVENHSR